MLTNGTRIDKITEMLAWLTVHVQLSNGQGRTDINHDAENFYCGLLNLVLDTSLHNLNYVERNYAAVDLGDPDKKLAIQVTSTNSRKKIEDTLSKFFEYKQDDDYNKLIILIIGKKERSKKPFKTERFFSFNPEQDVWDTALLCTKIDALSDEKKDAIIRYLDEQMQLPWEQRASSAPAPAAYSEPGERKLKRYLPITLGPDAFLGRKTELEKLGRALADNVNPIFITGLGGMGKTELAIRFCQKRPQDTLVHFVHFSGSFRSTVSSGIAREIENLSMTDYDNKPRPEPELYREAMDALRKCSRDTILIIDNADPADGDFGSLKDETYKELCGMDLRLVITTRAAIPDGVKVRPMERSDLRQLIYKYADDCADADADALIDAVDGHTLTVDLMARSMMGGWKRVTPAMLLEALRKNSLSADIRKTVSTDYNRTDKQARIHDHLRTVFQVADIPEEAQQALRCATLLPEAGLNADLFCGALPPAVQETLDALSDRGWLRVNKDMATIHPVVRLVCGDTLPLTDENCGSFLEVLWSRYDRKRYDHDEYTQLAELFTSAAEKLENRNGNWSAHGRTLWQEIGQYEKALLCARKTLERRLASLPGDHPDLADAYNDLGLAYQRLKDTQGMEEYFGKALDIRRGNPSVDPVDLGKSYNNVGVVYEEKKDYRTALDYKLKALAIFREHLPKDDLDLTISLHHVGNVYYDLQEFNTALEYYKEARMIREKVLPPDHPDIAYSYYDFGSTWYSLGNYQKALEFYEKAQDIQERILSQDHPDIAGSYHALGVTWYRLGDYQKALGFHKKARTIQEKILPPDHPDIAGSYHALGVTWYRLGNYQNALEFHEKARAIREKVLTADDYDLALSYHNVGTTYLKLKEYAPALEHLEKALPGFEANLSPGDPNIKAAKDAIAQCKRKLTRPNWMDQIH